ncbi:hypothetical protein CON63_07690 [Bacillus toyonensis]|nr:hypothetical protein CON63_07690 [Bacillus toyonensis]
MSINIISIVSIIIWIVLITELIKPSKEQNGRKIVTLLSAGSARTEWTKNRNFIICWFRIDNYFDGFIYSKYPVLKLVVI